MLAVALEAEMRPAVQLGAPVGRAEVVMEEEVRVNRYRLHHTRWPGEEMALHIPAEVAVVLHMETIRIKPQLYIIFKVGRVGQVLSN
jgi:hypothetical protein